jgi:hypothetical protein
MDATKPNPSNRAEPAPRKRIPMSIPQRRLEVPDMPGYHLHWFIDRNVERAIQGGYEFVDARDVQLNQLGVGTSRGVSGNVDLGSHVRVVGGVGEQGGVEYLTLMKIKEEFWLEDQRALEVKNGTIMSSIFRDEKIIGEDRQSPADQGTSYVKTALFQRPTRKAK